MLLAARGGLGADRAGLLDEDGARLGEDVIVVLLTVLLQPVALAHTTSIPQITPTDLRQRNARRLRLGLGAALLVGAATVAGDLMGMQIGLSGAAVLDPMSNT